MNIEAEKYTLHELIHNILFQSQRLANLQQILAYCNIMGPVIKMYHLIPKSQSSLLSSICLGQHLVQSFCTCFLYLQFIIIKLFCFFSSFSLRLSTLIEIENHKLNSDNKPRASKPKLKYKQISNCKPEKIQDLSFSAQKIIKVL